MAALDLQQIGKQVIDHLIGRALDGEFWMVDTQTLHGRTLVRFFVDGDLDAAIATMDPRPRSPTTSSFACEEPSTSSSRRAIGFARTPQVAHEHYQAAMSLAACAQLNANARGAIPWLRLARTTATTHQDSVRLADACFALGNAAAFADGSILASQCQVQLGMEAEALETLEAGAKALRQQDLEPFAELVEAQKAQLLRGEA